MQNQLPGQMGNQIGGPIGGIQTSMPQQMNQIGPGQLGPGQMQQQLNHIQRKVRNYISCSLFFKYIDTVLYIIWY